ncbi:hypothetical protein BC834DRAFT_850618 [Gloeopeniophorella convolvens]|nr:hypothetical protein BC834DRAFT_850618 [Gloeopeniophorella convolvens]
MHRKKPISGKHHKAQLQARRARKHTPTSSTGSNASLPKSSSARVAASARRLQSSFTSLSPALLDHSKLIAANRPLHRPINHEAGRLAPDQEAQMRGQMTCMRRPKWRYEMSKKEVEKNEEGLFAKWLSRTDALVEEWVVAWRVTEVSQIMMVLLDSRCPLLHFPPSLAALLSQPYYRTILVITKVDISGLVRAEAWAAYLRSKYPFAKVVMVESYTEKSVSIGGQGDTARQRRYEPHIPQTFKEQLVTALKEVHKEMLQPPERIRDDPEKMKSWKPRVKAEVDWDVVLHPTPTSPIKPAEKDTTASLDEPDSDAEIVNIGLIGQPNVGKSSLLNALFGTTRVKASKTPGKTKHFQTLYWSPELRLVDCPGLVLPDLVPLEMQVLGGVLPIARMPAIPLCIFFAANLLPLEKALGLIHPSASSPPAEDKRTWRDGMSRVNAPQVQEKAWTAMDIMTAYAEKRGWITAKAGRPDVNRAGNAILRLLAEGKVKWAFWPPDYDASLLSEASAGHGIWIPSTDHGPDEDAGTESDEDQGDKESDYEAEEGSEAATSTPMDGEPSSQGVIKGGGRFALLGLDSDSEDETEDVT